MAEFKVIYLNHFSNFFLVINCILNTMNMLGICMVDIRFYYIIQISIKFNLRKIHKEIMCQVMLKKSKNLFINLRSIFSFPTFSIFHNLLIIQTPIMCNPLKCYINCGLYFLAICLNTIVLKYHGILRPIRVCYVMFNHQYLINTFVDINM